jgi:hypothetical protein
MDDNVRMTGKPTTAPAVEGGPVTRRRALGDIGTNVTAASAPAVGKPAAAKPVRKLPRAELICFALALFSSGGYSIASNDVQAGRAEIEEERFDLAAHGIKDIDAAEMHDPNQFGSYAPQIYGYFKAMEVRKSGGC